MRSHPTSSRLPDTRPIIAAGAGLVAAFAALAGIRLEHDKA